MKKLSYYQQNKTKLYSLNRREGFDQKQTQEETGPWICLQLLTDLTLFVGQRISSQYDWLHKSLSNSYTKIICLIFCCHLREGASDDED